MNYNIMKIKEIKYITKMRKNSYFFDNSLIYKNK